MFDWNVRHWRKAHKLDRKAAAAVLGVSPLTVDLLPADRRSKLLMLAFDLLQDEKLRAAYVGRASEPDISKFLGKYRAALRYHFGVKWRLFRKWYRERFLGVSRFSG